ncbi:hypothetical protein L917_03576 [Phytophthora nicotianae]|uniref:Uncharacterized protein n=1 Tax=Phytophthora nicotianae TaxID=4792 RepID=W2JLH2_PHYNI|nr:hypothetical protein L915_03717 [Phytophthora nicotianae]ETL46453.1 hypothetical protein L916_03654 [Phytophthora nicotianae]ETL99589.1 hypothetical protein L917_03576 [Phytophthora nicotianae]ETM52737.1 hypothetical protein L914_03682 [Phytophthora nicotianae]
MLDANSHSSFCTSMPKRGGAGSLRDELSPAEQR